MKRIFLALAAAGFIAGFAGSALAVNFEFHGDFNHRFGLYTDQAGFFAGDKSDTGTAAKLNSDGTTTPAVAATGKSQAELDTGDREESFASIKYRLWTEAASDDGNIKGVYAVEIGAVRFGNSDKGGAFSGDGVNIETRWAYTDFQLPSVASKARVALGLMPFSVNSFLWNETATAVKFYTDNLTLAWARGKETITGSDDSWNDNDLDGLLVRYDRKGRTYNAGLFALYQTQEDGNSDTGATLYNTDYEIKKLSSNVKFDLTSLGTDGTWSTPTQGGDVFVNWDLIYQTGSMDNTTFTDVFEPAGSNSNSGDFDIQAYLLHADVGVNVGATRVTLTSWYASGDDDATDTDLDAFLSTDVDRGDSIVLFEGGFTDDFYFTERPYLADKGMFFNKLAVDHKASEKMSFGGAVLYIQTAEDVTLDDGSKEKNIGTELDAYVKYKLYPNVELALNAGFLFADDVMDVYEDDANAESDVDIFRSTAQVRYQF